MATTSQTDREFSCRNCHYPINLGEYITWDRRGGSGEKWHYNCSNPNLDPDIHGFPSRKDSWCSMGNACHRPRNTQRIVPGDMIKGIGTNQFAHIECTKTSIRRESVVMTPDDVANTVNAFDVLPIDVPTPNADAESPAPANGNDDAAIMQVIAALQDFISKQNVKSQAFDSTLEQLTNKLTVGDNSIVALTEQMTGIQSTLADLQERRPITIELHDADGNSVTRDMGYQHKNFSLLLRQCKLRDNNANHINVFLAGPAGSGKSTAAERVAEAMGLEFEVQGICLTMYELIGYISPSTNEMIETAFFRAYTKGKVLLADELDAWDQKALLKLNGALANGICDFPQGNFRRHKNFIIIGAANTWGHGGDSNYVGRNKLDATSKDRFLKIAWPYDESHERHIVGQTDNTILNAQTDHWVSMVQRARNAAQAAAAFIVISPRASLAGAMMIRAGDFSNEEIISSIFSDLRDPKVCPAWTTIGRELEEWALI